MPIKTTSQTKKNTNGSVTTITTRMVSQPGVPEPPLRTLDEVMRVQHQGQPGPHRGGTQA